MGPAPTENMSGSLMSTIKVLRTPILENDGSNWITYKERLLNVVTSKGLRRHITGTIDEKGKKPEPSPLSDDIVEAMFTKLDEFEQKEAQLREIIYETVNKTTFLQIKNEERASDVWARLVHINENKGTLYQLDTLAKLQAKRLLEGTDVHAHLAEMVEIAEKLAGMGYNINIPAAMATSSSPSATSEAIADCGATLHFTPDRHLFLNYTEIEPEPIKTADGQTLCVAIG
ncbi:hypothetical protein BDN71DRAFT_1463050 [Pleurotus eryngii]|uniref:Uncharacterized protein n=1 Tax=Pleurotus eryngii TaxID=5323 RepID=A0A9P6A628_PLEER|nr:hypothetical protein BDN71DRAFT_1463050 [Pleurotus eryngii]